MNEIIGNCFCESIQYIVREIEPVASICHCNFCRKLHGSDFTTWVSIPYNKFKVVEGKEFLTSFRATENNTTHFCNRCGTKVYSVDSRYPNASILRGTIKTPIDIRVVKQWFLENRIHQEN